jgi:hypothetical protein
MKNENYDNEIFSYREGCFLVAVGIGSVGLVVLLVTTIWLIFFK